MKKPITNILLFAILYLTAASASAALVTSPLNGVTILGHVYNITFKADDTLYDDAVAANLQLGAALQSYNELVDPGVLMFAGSNSTKAEAAAAAIGAHVGYSTTHIWNPGGQLQGSPNYNRFRIAYLTDQVTYNFITYSPTHGVEYHTLVDVDAANHLSLASFELAEVPVPAAVWLFGSALLGFGFLRRKGVSA
ncbi:MAG: hypothetical protein ABW168_24545 [Sedimenticola sp.]